jgi:hypothetical protein
MRATGGVFVWAIESMLLALFGVGTISIIHMVGGTSSIATDMWAIFVVLCSCVVNLILQTVVACSSKQATINEITEGVKSDFAMVYMHKAVAQGHCSIVTLVLVMYIITMQQSLINLDWANAYFASAPGLVWVTGTITLAFLTVLWFTSMAGAWAATATGDSNTLFVIIPTTAILCIMFPILNEIGINGLMVCSNPMSSTLAVLYANLALATSFTICLLDCVEFDPARILPKFMRTVGNRLPSFRIYSMIHGICASITIVMYWIVARGISTPTVVILLSANGIVTVTNSLSATQLVISWAWGNGGAEQADRSDTEIDPNQSDPDYEHNDIGVENDRPTTPDSVEPAAFGRNKDSEELFSRMRGPQKRQIKMNQPPPNQTQKRTHWTGLDMTRLQSFGVATGSKTTHAVMSIAERRIALLRLDNNKGLNLHNM